MYVKDYHYNANDDTRSYQIVILDPQGSEEILGEIIPNPDFHYNSPELARFEDTIFYITPHGQIAAFDLRNHKSKELAWTDNIQPTQISDFFISPDGILMVMQGACDRQQTLEGEIYTYNAKDCSLNIYSLRENRLLLSHKADESLLSNSWTYVTAFDEKNQTVTYVIEKDGSKILIESDEGPTYNRLSSYYRVSLASGQATKVFESDSNDQSSSMSPDLNTRRKLTAYSCSTINITYGDSAAINYSPAAIITSANNTFTKKYSPTSSVLGCID